MAELDRKEFQILLFRTAFCLMACDGHLDEREIAEIRSMNKLSSYFKGIDLSVELEDLLKELKVKGKQIVDDLFESLIKYDLSIVQELLVLEIAFRIQNADEILHENEIRFIKVLRSKLKLQDQIIKDRFGVIDYLFDKDYSVIIQKEDLGNDYYDFISIPEIKEIEEIDF